MPSPSGNKQWLRTRDGLEPFLFLCQKPKTLESVMAKSTKKIAMGGDPKIGCAKKMTGHVKKIAKRLAKESPVKG